VSARHEMHQGGKGTQRQRTRDGTVAIGADGCPHCHGPGLIVPTDRLDPADWSVVSLDLRLGCPLWLLDRGTSMGSWSRARVSITSKVW
jgi:hypothetical protein